MKQANVAYIVILLLTGSFKTGQHKSNRFNAGKNPSLHQIEHNKKCNNAPARQRVQFARVLLANAGAAPQLVKPIPLV